VQAIEREMSPKLAAFNDKIVQNSQLFARLSTLYDARDRLGLTAEQQRLLWVEYTRFVRSGAKLDDAAKLRLAALNQQRASLDAKVRKNGRAEENTETVVLKREAARAALRPALRAAAAPAAPSRGQTGKWAIVNPRSSVEPSPTLPPRRDLREKVFR